MSNIIRHAIHELSLLDSDNETDSWMHDNVMDLLSLFADQGHSGSSAAFCVSMFEKLALYKVLTPLTGEDDEWEDIGEDDLQNKRASNVFKNKKTGECYDIDGVVFLDKEGAAFTNDLSRVSVVFPYVPKTAYVNVKEDIAGEVAGYLAEKMVKLKCDMSAAVFFDTKTSSIQCCGKFTSKEDMLVMAHALGIASAELKESSSVTIN
jgi:hypothetical protein